MLSKNEEKKLKTHIQGFEPGSANPVAKANLEGQLDACQPGLERRDRRKSRENLLIEKERRAKEERERELRARRERLEERQRHEAELMAQIRREKAEAERKRQRELIAAQVAAEREREKREKEERKKALAAALEDSSDSDAEVAEQEPMLELVEETARHDESIIRIPATINPAPTPVQSASEPLKADLIPAKLPPRKDTPMPVRAADTSGGDRREAIQAKLKKASLKKPVSRTNGVQFAKGYRENAVPFSISSQRKSCTYYLILRYWTERQS